MTKSRGNNAGVVMDRYGKIDPTTLVDISKPYSKSFYERSTLNVAREILGSLLVREIDGEILAGFIIEGEAYIENEEGCHAFNGVTPRCEIMFGPGGMAYIYFVYGMYWCLNATTEKEGRAGAVLIRSVEPISGLDFMKRKRKKESTVELCSGPGKLTVSFALDNRLNGWDLSKPPFRILEPPRDIKPELKIKKTRRIGLKKAKHLEYRFCIDNSPYISHS